MKLPKITKEKTGRTADSVTKLTCQGMNQTQEEAAAALQCPLFSPLFLLSNQVKRYKDSTEQYLTVTQSTKKYSRLELAFGREPLKYIYIIFLD